MVWWHIHRAWTLNTLIFFLAALMAMDVITTQLAFKTGNLGESNGVAHYIITNFGFPGLLVAKFLGTIIIWSGIYYLNQPALRNKSRRTSKFDNFFFKNAHLDIATISLLGIIINIFIMTAIVSWNAYLVMALNNFEIENLVTQQRALLRLGVVFSLTCACAITSLILLARTHLPKSLTGAPEPPTTTTKSILNRPNHHDLQARVDAVIAARYRPSQYHVTIKAPKHIVVWLRQR